MENDSCSSAVASITGYPRFLDCPLEVRNIIWTYALENCEPRLVYLWEQTLLIDQSIYARVRSDNETPPTQLELQPTRAFLSIPTQSIPSQDNTNMTAYLNEYRINIEAFIANREEAMEPEIYFESRMSTENEGRTLLLPEASRMRDLNPMEGDTHKVHYLVVRDDGAGTTEVEWSRVSVPEVPHGFRRTLPIPSLLLACRESNSVASKVYQLAFSTLGCLSEVHFDFTNDYLFVDLCSFSDPRTLFTRLLCLPLQVASHDFQRVQNLSVFYPPEFEYGSEEEYLCVLLGVFGNVKNLTILAKSLIASAGIYSPLGKLSQGPVFNTYKDFKLEAGTDIETLRYIDTDMLEDLKNRSDQEREEAERDQIPLLSYKWEMPRIGYAVFHS